jgi:hypothetical protein
MPFQITTPHHQVLVNEIYPRYCPYDARESCDLYREGGLPLGITEALIATAQTPAAAPKIETPRKQPTLKIFRDSTIFDKKVMRDFFAGQ